MPGQSNDRLEQFFRKATNRPQLTFSEEDWKKLEERLDAADAEKLAEVKTPRKIITASIVALFLLATVGIWWKTSETAQMNVTPSDTALSPSDLRSSLGETTESQKGTKEDAQATDAMNGSPEAQQNTSPSTGAVTKNRSTNGRTDKVSTGSKDVNEGGLAARGRGVPTQLSQEAGLHPDLSEIPGSVMTISSEQVAEELIVQSPRIAERNTAVMESNKQRAPIELPGAEEADETGRQTIDKEEHASDKTGHVARPRLSLLLFFAPDFSGTSLGRYSTPGKAFGAIIHYHPGNRWSISTGAIKNNKTYTGDGNDYAPPKGYWKYYTNGVIPESIDGSCSILEFPLMVQYTVLDRSRSRWILGAGTSSYLMQSESYRYHFDQPNPGAKEGWSSRGSSRFLFNMLNLTVGYECQILPDLMLGLEPYIKLPLEEIGWSSLRLYSTGASVTLRYTLISRKQTIPAAFRSRGPD